MKQRTNCQRKSPAGCRKLKTSQPNGFVNQTKALKRIDQKKLKKQHQHKKQHHGYKPFRRNPPKDQAFFTCFSQHQSTLLSCYWNVKVFTAKQILKPIGQPNPTERPKEPTHTLKEPPNC